MASVSEPKQFSPLTPAVFSVCYMPSGFELGVLDGATFHFQCFVLSPSRSADSAASRLNFALSD